MSDLDLIASTARNILTVADGKEGEIWARLEHQGMLQPSLLTEGPAEALSIERILVQEVANACVGLPVAETIVANSELHAAGIEPAWSRLSFAIDLGAGDLSYDGRYVFGRLKRVPWGRDVDAVLASAHDHLFVLPAKAARVETGANLAGEPRDDLIFSRAVPEVAKRASHSNLRAHGALMRAAQLVSASERALALTVAYARVRTQFGKPIGEFQAVQHQLAAAYGDISAAKMAVLQGYRALSLSERGDFNCGIAKARASDAGSHAARAAHQVHGAIGYTMEYELQRYTGRIQSWRAECGSSAYWRARIADVLAKGETKLWHVLSS